MQKTVKGTITLDDIMASGNNTSDLILVKHRELQTEYGPGNLSHKMTNGGRGIDWEYTYEASEGSADVNATIRMQVPMTPELVEAIRLARVNLCNMSAVKQSPNGKYVPLVSTDENAQAKCNAINELEVFLIKWTPLVRS